MATEMLHQSESGFVGRIARLGGFRNVSMNCAAETAFSRREGPGRARGLGRKNG
jgi:hypothetical protein